MLQLTIYHDLSLILNPEAKNQSSEYHESYLPTHTQVFQLKSCIPQFIKAPFHCFTMLPAFSSNFFFALKRRFITPHLTEPTWQSGNRLVASVHWVHPLLPVSLHPKHTLDPNSWSLKSDEQCTRLCDLRTPAVAFKSDSAATKKTHSKQLHGKSWWRKSSMHELFPYAHVGNCDVKTKSCQSHWNKNHAYQILRLLP